jgi:hypothetical protein
MRLACLVLATGCGFQAQAAALDDTSATLDASFNLATCPVGYDVVLPGPSRYRLIATAAHADLQITACNNDLPGRTHLVVLDSVPELVAVSMLLDNEAPGAIAGDSIWIGGVQQRTALLPADNWLGFDDLPLIANQWAVPTEPNDGGGPLATTELDHGEQFVSIKRGKRYFSDTSRATSYGALCECDGKPVGTLAAAAITSNL